MNKLYTCKYCKEETSDYQHQCNLKNNILQGNSLEVLKSLPEKSINMCMTSPPYWALRDYGEDEQLGLEPTYDQYINNLCDIFDEVKRVLRDDGTCWVNIGDSYMGGGTGGQQGRTDRTKEVDTTGLKVIKGDLSPKCLIGIPMRFAIEMMNRGWILRNTIIWHKPNCMPSSVKDRFTVDFEYIFFFSKKKKYYFEQQKEPHKSNDPRAGQRKIKEKSRGLIKGKPDIKNQQYHSKFICYGKGGRNKRAVWKIPTSSFKEAHFATYPERLCETPIKAGCPEGGIVLDPFFGAGTTGLVALKQRKNYLGIELNPEYIEIARKRLNNVQQEL